MTQVEMINNFIDTLDINFTSECQLILIKKILDNLLNILQYEQESEQNKKDFNTLTTISLTISEIMKSNGIKED